MRKIKLRFQNHPGERVVTSTFCKWYLSFACPLPLRVWLHVESDVAFRKVEEGADLAHMATPLRLVLDCELRGAKLLRHAERVHELPHGSAGSETPQTTSFCCFLELATADPYLT